ncbi:MAG TPA: GNAT family N-acetyltransferase [Gemmatimonadaceae bacterium]|nr:GNAT family N-acetyltransferase [Gemmatimonadaceae bacterium]
MTTPGHASGGRANAGLEVPPEHPRVDVDVRHLATHDEFVACVDLQHKIWGAGFSERVPAAILKVSQRIGGVTAGAFDENGDIVGFVFGMTGVENGELVHWSDMLAVRADLRDHGIGRILKEFQLHTLLERGVARIYWTFDPLVARNAHLNFNRLNVDVAEYVINMYGSETDSVLHRGLGSDRFIVVRPVAASKGDVVPLERHRAEVVASVGEGSRILNKVDGTGTPAILAPRSTPDEPVYRIAIPLDIEKVQSADISLAARWRESTRRAILWGLEHGYRILGFYRDDLAASGFYVMTTAPRAERAPSPSTIRFPFNNDAA